MKSSELPLRSRLGVAFLVVGAVSLSTSCSSPPRQADVAVIGDSFTAGSDMGGRDGNGWPDLVGQSLDREGYEVTLNVAAEGGAGYVKKGQKGNTFEVKAGEVVDPDVDVVVFFGGLNDGRVDISKVADAARETLGQAAEAAPDARLVVIGPVWPRGQVPESMVTLDRTLRVAAQEAGAVYIDPIAQGWFSDRPDLIGVDGTHPTDAGHRYLAARISPIIRGQIDGLP